MNNKKRLFKYFLLLCFFSIISICGCYTAISWNSNKYIYNNLTTVPKKEVGVVLGTSKYLSNKNINEFYKARIDAAIKLYKAGKVRYFVVSGDNHKNSYNEPKQMRDDLIAAGIPASHVQPDYAGLRTLDSILRMEKIFGHKNYMIISQEFHNQRALFIARSKGHTPIAFSAQNPRTLNMTKVIIREFFARILAISDVITNKKARFYGKTINFPPTTP